MPGLHPGLIKHQRRDNDSSILVDQVTISGCAHCHSSLAVECSSWINWRIMSACEPGNATSHARETVFPGKSIRTSACPRMFSTKQGEVGPTAKIQPAIGAFACLVLFRGINARKAHHLTTNLQSSVTQDHDNGGARVLLVSLAGKAHRKTARCAGTGSGHGEQTHTPTGCRHQ